MAHEYDEDGCETHACERCELNTGKYDARCRACKRRINRYGERTCYFEWDGQGVDTEQEDYL